MANNKNIDKQSINLLPTFFRTDKNQKFLSSTLDQLTKTPELERIDGFVGSKLSKNFNYASDVYISESLPLRQKYQLEPGLIVKELDGSIKKAFGFDDLVNQIGVYGGNNKNLDQLFRPNFSSYNPRIDWDKFINFREYYWLPNGPDYVFISGTQKNTIKTGEVSTYTVTDSADGNFFIFTPDGLTEDPLLTFFRGVTYVFNVTSVHKFYFKTSDTADAAGQYNHGIIGNGTVSGQIIFTVDDTTPSVLYYGTDDNHVVGGRLLVKKLLENSVIDVENQILNKVQYRSGNGIEFINGLKVRFAGEVTPAEYADKDFIVEGVGEGIKLVEFSKLTSPDNIGTIYNDNFDETPFDEFSFDNFKNLPLVPEYVTINKSSNDLNPWSRYNRWFHSDVIKFTAIANGDNNPVYLQTQRASRPIIEFIPDMQLWNFCEKAVDSIDLIDTITTDAFSKVEKTVGYYVDGVRLAAGHRVIFNADPDPLVKGKIFEVSLAIIDGQEFINLIEIMTPNVGDGVVINMGDTHTGQGWWFNGDSWVVSQQRTVRNQAPMFDLFDKDGFSFSNPKYYNSEFFGNQIFGYMTGSGAVDPVLGFPLKYYNDIGLEGTYLFNNFFGTESISIIGNNVVTSFPSYTAYLKINKSSPTYINVWTPADPYQIPVLQFQIVSSNVKNIEINVFDNAATINDLTVSVFVDDVKQNISTDFTLEKIDNKLFVTFKNNIDGSVIPKRVLIKCYTLANPNDLGTYETPLNLTNNPLNDVLSSLTLSELSDHVKSMIDKDPNFIGAFPGVSNLKSLPNSTKYGSRLIGNNNPLSFAHSFITNVENSLIDSIRQSSNDYYQFKLNLIKFISQVGGQLSPADVLDSALASIIQNKNSSFPYGRSDMIGYGNNNITRTYIVTDSRNKNYSITSIFDNSILSDRSVLVYLNNSLLTYEKDYIFEKYDASVLILATITKGDVVVIKDYNCTDGSYIPPTPTKLGLYPKFVPSIFIDYTYVDGPVKVIQGHDGSLTVAYSDYNDKDDFRDLALLEYETRVYNNLKILYNQDLIDINNILPGVFRSQYNSYKEIYNIIQGDFLKWASVYGIDYSSNLTYQLSNHKTYNYKSAIDTIFNKTIPGNWRGIYKYYFDTDRPDTHPWEMLGFSVKPTWWESEYGPAPYTSGNLTLWKDLENGMIRQGSRMGINKTYARPGLSNIIPVDEHGGIIDIRNWASLAKNDSIIDTDQEWSFGDHGPAETSWRRSSQWPFAVQIILALTKPADYAAKMFDTSRLIKDKTGQYIYNSNSDHKLLNPASVVIPNDVDSSGNLLSTSGYSVWVVEHGKQRRTDYIQTLKNDLSLISFNLCYKAGGFLSKDKLSVIIDSIDPASPNPGVLLPVEDYTLHFNVSAPIKSAAISGIIVEKNNGKYVVKGYDKRVPYFFINSPIHRSTDSLIIVGGKSEPFLTWNANSFYQSGQIVSYDNSYYRVLKSHNTGSAFISANYSILSKIPTVGGVSILTTKEFDSVDIMVPYGTKYSTVQEVYDFIVGYGKWLENQGFIFDEYNKELAQILNWSFTGKEFLYWTTQNWADKSVIALSPFSNSLKYKFIDSAVDNVLNSFYEYSLLTATGQSFPKDKFFLSRENGTCSISTRNTTEGLFYARLNLVQKEHVIILNNKSIFNDTIYDIDTGYRQSRIRLIGFKTANWNGDFLSPGFIYDDAQISIWQSYTDYKIAEIVKYVGKYYSANQNIVGTASFDFAKWTVLGTKPVAQLLPNFDYKINQFEDFYSLDIDNFDAGQQKMAQHLIGYTPRNYLNNIFVNPIAQYKFYQGFIKEKGTRNAIDKLAKASIHNLKGQIDFNEEWAFRIGSYGNFTSYNQIEFPLKENDFRENSQLIKFVDTSPTNPNDTISYINPTEVTIKNADYLSNSVFLTTSSTDGIILPVAGYVKADDVTATAYNNNSILDIANNGNIKEGNTVWLGFRDDGEWDVYRYTKQPAKVIGSSISIPTKVIAFTTDKFHNLSAGNIVSIVGLDNSSDGVYIVQRVTSLNSFEAATTMASLSVSNTSALLFKFVSVRVDNFDEIANLQDLINFKENDLIWADTNIDGRWEVYKKLKNYSTKVISTTVDTQIGQQYGYKIATSSDGSIVIISSPGYVSQTSRSGRIFVYNLDNGTMIPVVNYGPASKTSPTNYFTGTNVSNFGSSLIYDNATAAIFAGAPNASYVGANAYLNEGIVKVSKINFTLSQEVVLHILKNPNPQNNGLFGSSIYVSKDINPVASNQLMLIGAPGQNKVYTYSVSENADTSTITLLGANSQGISGNQYGYAISGSAHGDFVAVSAPSDNNIGAVYILNNPGVGPGVQTISAPSICKVGDQFGSSVLMSDDGLYLFVASTVASTTVNAPGKVFVYKNTGTQFTTSPIQIINNPRTDMQFGISMSIDSTSKVLVVTAQGNSSASKILIDSKKTTFDSNTCNFINIIANSGSSFVFNRNNEMFVYAEELADSSQNPANNSNYGQSSVISGSQIFVGASGSSGKVFLFDKIDPTVNSWAIHSTQPDLIDISKIKNSSTIDTFEETVIDYLDIIDPVKGRIAGLADQEIRYKTAFDPAIYSIGVDSVVVDTNTSWIEEHLGELWWDLSTVKYQWYEQSDIEYRKNTWGTLFPGASIDVYEWVSSEYLPSQWSAIADTPAGLMQGISGQPKYPDNSVVSVKQYYNSNTGASTNVYYFWVKNKVIVPDVNGRKTSASDVAGLIFNPNVYGTKFVSILAPNAISVTNVKDSLTASRIYLNISKDDIDNDINRHTEWLLLEENSASSMPNSLLDKKLLDSLLGKDSVGNPVPDANLPERTRYGVEVRPRQTLFKDRTGALRNLFEYTNTVLSQNIISNFVNFKNLNSKDEIPFSELGQYDKIVDDIENLHLVFVGGTKTAALSCSISNGKIISVSIDNPGSGYNIAPAVEIIGDTSGSSIKTTINDFGQIISAEIINPGFGLIDAPTLIVRPYTVVVRADSTINNVWSKYQYVNKTWTLVYTQQYNTTLYWDYIDWISSSYDSLKPLSATIDQPYLLDSLNLIVGDYVKVNNQGNGKYIILKKVKGNGTFDNNYDLLYSEKGTIKLKDILWNKVNSSYNFDYQLTYDQSLFDQSPEIELAKILYSIKNDIFVGPLKIYWNKFFFKAVRYAMSEQKFLDWAFKTSFINVKNMAGLLDQRPVYKFQNSQYYEEYINEVKPYHTKIRNFQVNYDIIDPTHSYTTDFDLAPTYDQDTHKFTPVSLDDTLMNVYPRKGWYDNYKLKVGKITLTNSGKGYTSVPSVQIITAQGDLGSGATAIAYISLGKVIEIEITNPGSGYTLNPTVVISGGGPTDLIPAKAYAVLINEKIRSNTIGIKFDRISTNREIGSTQYSDSFVCDGNEFEFKLSWAAQNKKSLIDIKLDGITVLSSDYQVVTYKELFNGYHKTYSKIVLTYAPLIGQVLSVTYSKNINLYNAIDRIADFYNPTSGMPGKENGQLMTGISYPGVQLQTLPFSYSANWDTLPFAESSWGDNSSDADLDTIIDGGAWSTLTNALVNATGINPSDIILDGDAFVSPNVSHAPEELLPGQVLESVGISVYTRAERGSPVMSQIMQEVTSTTLSTVVQLSMLPPNTGTLMVSFNNKILNYGSDYNVDFSNKTLTVSTQTVNGLIGVTVVGIGGIDYISSDYSTVSNTNKITIDAEALYDDIGSAYVSLNGKSLTTSEYTLSTISSKNKRGRVTVTGLTSGTNTLQAWFFGATYKGFSEVKEQRIYPNGFSNSFILDQFPGNIGPAHANAVVELNKKRLVPPNTVYYSVSNGQIIFDIDPNNEYPSGVFDLASLEVHINGIKIRNGVDFILDQPNQQIKFKNGFLKTNDVMAITNIVYSDYYISNGRIYIPRIALSSGDMIKVITYSNHDGSLIRTEVFKARGSRRYTMDRPLVNDDYVWVSIGGNTLINSFDYYIDTDGKTIVIDDGYPFNELDMVVIVSMTDVNDSAVIGYRIFKDILNRTHYKRLSYVNSTRLAAPLYTTSTEIYVENDSVLPVPYPSKNIPGIILIAGERIEYMELSNNTLSRIKRGTLGTGAKDFYPVGTLIVDQGSSQTVPFKENIITYTTSTTGGVSNYILPGIKFNSLTTATDQVEVYYGGILLRKPTINSVTLHDPSIAFDSGETNASGISSDIELDPEFTIELSGETNILHLNSSIININTGTRIVVIQKTAVDWYNDSVSLLADSSVQASFLRDKQSALPDKYHYGQL